MVQLQWSRSILLMSFFAFLVICQNNNNSVCYYPNSIVAKDFAPCDPTAFISKCCPEGWTCFSNNLCIITDPHQANASSPVGSIIRSACTSPVWANGVCSSVCLDDANFQGFMTSCGNETFCCNADLHAGRCSCSTLNGTVTVENGIAQTVIGVVGSPAISTAIITPSYTASPNLIPTNGTTRSTLSAGTIAGIVIGGIAGLLSVIMGIFWCFRSRKLGAIPQQASVPQQASAPNDLSPDMSTPHILTQHMIPHVENMTYDSRMKAGITGHEPFPLIAQELQHEQSRSGQTIAYGSLPNSYELSARDRDTSLSLRTEE